MAKLIFVDETEITIEEQYGVIDDVYEFITSVSDYTELSQLSNKLTDDNLKKVIIKDGFGNETEYNNLSVGMPVFYINTTNDFEINVTVRLKQKSEQDSQLDTVVDVAQSFDDETALTVKSIYPVWDTLVGKTVKINTKFTWYDVLYKTKQPDMLIQKQYQPGTIGTESLYECIDETHEGTYEDPIPYSGNMTLEKGKFYIQDGVIYACTYDSGVAVYDRLEYLSTFVTEYEYAKGTLEDPIKWYGGGLPIEKFKYYIQDDTTYIGIANSDIPVYGDLSALSTYVDKYVYAVGTLEDPIKWYGGGLPIYKYRFYTQNDEMYIGIKDSDGNIEGNLSELSDYVEKYVESEGTLEDPIHWYGGGLPIKADLYYEQDGDIYVGIINSEVPLIGNLADLESYVSKYTPEPEYNPGDTPDNPIPYQGAMYLKQGKYYIQDGVVYQCIADTEKAVSEPLNTLSDYVIKVEDDEETSTEPDEGDGTDQEPENPDSGDGEEDPWKPEVTQPTGDSSEDPIPWVVGSKLYEGKYYIDKDVVYLCIRDSGIDMAYNLADLVSGGYVQDVE